MRWIWEQAVDAGGSGLALPPPGRVTLGQARLRMSVERGPRYSYRGTAVKTDGVQAQHRVPAVLHSSGTAMLIIVNSHATQRAAMPDVVS